MKNTPLLLTFASLSLMSSCSTEPCLARGLQAHMENCRNCRATAVHLGTAEEHVNVCPETADNQEHYGVQPGT